MLLDFLSFIFVVSTVLGVGFVGGGWVIRTFIIIISGIDCHG